jgi:PKD repeat protein
MVRRPRLPSVVAALVAVLLTATLLPLPSSASSVSHTDVVSDKPSNRTPHVLDGWVESVIQVGSTTILGGVFTQVQNPDRTQTFDRQNLVAFDTATGEIDPSLTFSFNNDVTDLVPAADGRSFYIGGAFFQVNGQQHGRVVRVDAVTGQIDPAFRSSGFNNRVTALELSGDTLYVGGSFTESKGVPRTLVASLDADTGALTDRVDVTFADIWSGTTLRVNDMSLNPSGTKLVVAGNFRKVAGLDRAQLAVLDVSGGPATLDAWSTATFAQTCMSKFEGYIKDIDVSPDGRWFAVATTGAYSGGAPKLCDSVSRWELTSASNQKPTWVNYSGGDTLTKVSIAGDVLYAGGHQRWMNNPYRGDAAGPGAVPREGLSAHDVRNGLPYTWNPGRTRGVGVYDFLPTSAGLWIASDTDRISGFLYRGRIAFMPGGSGDGLPREKTGSLPGDAVSLTPAQTTATLLTSDGANDSRVLSDAPSWAGVRGATMIDDTVYYGWSDGRLLSRTFDGVRFGAEQAVDLRGLTDPEVGTRNFSADIRNLGSLFFDRTTGRLYYTLVGSNTLYYRYFTTQSQVVGAQRFEASSPSTPVPWASVRGAFLADGSLFYVLTDGVLRRVAWTNGQATGTPTVVSGPSIDGRTWPASGLFLSTRTPPLPPVAVLSEDCQGLDCTFDAGDSVDPNGQPLMYRWDFGDGSTGTGASAQYSYGADGTYTVRLTVTDSDGMTSTVTKTVKVAAPANQPPTAAFTPDCSGTACSFDASDSTDPEGGALTYAWNFGDGTTATVALAQHTFVASGTYPVTLTVTDPAGASASLTQDVTVSVAALDFRGSSKTFVQATTMRVPIPAQVQQGDVLLLLVTANQDSATRTLTAPAGWTAMGVQDDTVMQSRVWWRRAGAADAGQSVAVTASARTRLNGQVLAYSGVGDNPVAVSAAEPRWTAAHTTPATTEAAGAWVVSYWSDKSDQTTGWTVPPSVALRELNADDRSTGRVSSVSADSGRPVPGGAVGGVTATASAAHGRATMWTIVLGP